MLGGIHSKGICCTYLDHRGGESYKPCMFPFTFKNHTFNTCVDTRRDGPICPTSNQHDDWYIKFTYGTCDQGVCKNFKRGNSRYSSNQYMPCCLKKLIVTIWIYSSHFFALTVSEEDLHLKTTTKANPTPTTRKIIFSCP